MNHNLKKLNTVKAAPKSRSMGPHVRQVIPSGLQDVDPFVFLDHFGPFMKLPDAQGVPPHPHAGIATITYLLEGTNVHRDSLGNEATVNSGDLAWMQAGKGIIHAEGMGGSASQNIHGLQFWISLPAKDKFADPYFKHYRSEDLPELQLEHATVKVLLGKIGDSESPVQSLSPAYIFDIQADANAVLSIYLGEGTTAAAYTLEGELMSDDGRLIPAAHIAGFSRVGDTLELRAGNAGARVVLLGGVPLNEPIVAYASFVMNTFDQINQVIQDYSSGKMGTLN